MLPEETQAAIVYNAFIDEFTKTAGPRLEGLKAVGSSMLAHFRAGRAAKAISVAEKATQRATEASRLAIDSKAALEKRIAPAAKNLEKPKGTDNRSLAGAAAVLGLGGLGFGYYQYKKNQHDQLTGTYPQIS